MRLRGMRCQKRRTPQHAPKGLYDQAAGWIRGLTGEFCAMLSSSKALAGEDFPTLSARLVLAVRVEEVASSNLASPTTFRRIFFNSRRRAGRITDSRRLVA